MLSALLLASALATAAPPARAAAGLPPTPIFRSYGVADGLPSASVYSVTQDHTGYLWIGTRDGLVRHDSQGFRVFRHDPAQPASLPNNDISAMAVDHVGQLWVGGEGTGLNLYDPTNGSFRHWLHDPAKADSLPANDVMAIAEDRAGRLWVGVYAGGLNQLAPDGAGFRHWRHRSDDPASIASDNVTALAPADDGGLWIGTDVGLDHLDAQGRITHVALAPDAQAATIWQLRAGTTGVDAATSIGLYHLDADRRARLLGPAREALASLRETDGGLWIAQRGGLLHLAAHASAHFEQPVAGVAGGLPGRLPDGLFRDTEGGLWIALLDGGLAYLPPQWRAFSMFRNIPGDADSLARNRVRALALARTGDLWVAGAGMLDRLDPGSGRVTHTAVPVIENMSISTLAEDPAGRLWLGAHNGCFMWDGKQLHAVAPEHPALRHGARRLLVAGDGQVYLAGVGSGMFRVDPQTFAIQPLAVPANSEAAREANQLRESADGTVWVASKAGLLRLARGAHAFAFTPGIATGEVQAIAFTPDHELWLARPRHLERYRLAGDGSATLQDSIGPAQGWPDSDIVGLQVNRDGRVFALSARSLLVFDPENRQLQAFATAEGLATTDFTGDALLTAGHGRLFAGSLAGVIGIRAAALPRAPTPPKVTLESVNVRRNGMLVELDPRLPIQLDWRDRELTVTADVLSFVDPARNAYRFRLHGFDPGWVETGYRNVREFSLLEPGNYRLLISGRSGNGPWSAPVEALRLQVAAAPWNTPWARGLYGLAILGVLALVAWTWRRRLQQQHRLALSEERQQVAEQANAAKSRFLANMAHEIRTPLTGVLGMTELLLRSPLQTRQHQYADAIRRSGALLLRQVNDALDVARIEAGRLELASSPFAPAAVLHEVAEAEAGVAAQKNLVIDVVIDACAPHAVFGDALRVQQILLNLVHNALKFTPAGKVMLALGRDDPGIVYTITDQGAGMTAAECARIFQRFEQTDEGRQQRGSGLGLAISRELVGLMGGSLAVQSEPGRGSSFSVRLPLAEAPAASEPAPAPARDPTAETAGSVSGPLAPHILLVEDDPIAGQAIAGLIESFGYRVTWAPQALAALAEITGGRDFAVLVCDFDLPGIDGCELARMLRQRGVAAPILALTASAHGDEEQRARDAGMNALLRKPVPPDELAEALCAATRSGGSRAHGP